ncbi:MAG: hypothetical protein HZB84_04285 [Deltaproteobacteria bacterium]|nr:hypothetical protein [Deltaproteobacteria bacterium]
MGFFQLRLMGFASLNPSYRATVLPCFGTGVIKERSGQGQDAKLTVNFKDYGVKKLVVNYASLYPIS